MFEDEGFMDRVAESLCRRGWQQPAALALELGRPLTLVAGQALWMVQPILRPVVSAEAVADAARLLEEPEQVDALIRRLRQTA